MKRAIAKKTTTRLVRRQRLARMVMGIVAAGSMILAGQSADGCDFCGAESVASACDSCSASTPACDSCAAPRAKKGPNPLFKAMDAFAGGIESVMGFDKCKSCSSGGCDSGACDSGCDDACDASMIQELSMPIAPAYPPAQNYVPSPGYSQEYSQGYSQGHQHAAPPAPFVPAPIQSAPRMAPMQTAPRVIAPVPMTDMRMSEPMIVSPDAVPFESVPSQSERNQYQDYNSEMGSFDEPTPAPPAQVPFDATPEPEAMAPRQVTPNPIAPIPDSVPNAAPQNPLQQPSIPDDGGGLFDSLDDPIIPGMDDPFGDDEVRLPHPYRTIRPSNYRKTTVPVHPSSYRRLSPPVELQAPQTRSGYTSSKTRQVAGNPRAAVQQSSSRRASVDQMRREQIAQQHRVATVKRTTQQSHSSRVVQATANYQYGTRQKQTVQRTAHQHTGHQNTAHQHTGHQNTAHQHLRTAPLPRSASATATRQPTGQRHSTANYSGYGHTTNRSSGAATSSRRTATSNPQSSRRTSTIR